MKYLFFDIECSNCFGKKPKMCEFGYVITNENFKIIKKDDIPMSPGRNNRANRFDNGVYKRDPSFSWAYECKEYFNFKEFPNHYEFIKNLFEDKDTIIFGYSTTNDIHYLNYTLERYNLDFINYDAYDIQIFTNHYFKSKNSIGLEKAFKMLCPINEFIRLQPHLPQDDSIMSMRILEEICKRLNKLPKELIKEYNDSKYNSEECLNNFKRKMEREALEKEGRKILDEFYLKCYSHINDERYKGKIVNISSNFKINKDELKLLISFLEDNGFISCKSVSTSNFIIALDNDDSERIKTSLKYPYDGKILSFEEFKKANS